jgi:thiamine kinase-like enzyme
LDEVEKTFLYPGYEAFFGSLLNRDSEMVLSHNDINNTNILLDLHDNEKVHLLDIEFSNIGPIAMDLGVFINEAAYSADLKVYVRNLPSNRQIETICKQYLEIVHRRHHCDCLSFQHHWAASGKQFVSDVQKCCLL